MWDWKILPCEKGELSVHSYGWALHIVRGCILCGFSLSGSELLHALSPAVSSLCLFLEESVCFAFAWLCWALPLSWGVMLCLIGCVEHVTLVFGADLWLCFLFNSNDLFLLLFGSWSFGWTFLFSFSSSVIVSYFPSCLVLFLLCFHVSTFGCRSR